MAATTICNPNEQYNMVLYLIRFDPLDLCPYTLCKYSQNDMSSVWKNLPSSAWCWSSVRPCSATALALRCVAGASLWSGISRACSHRAIDVLSSTVNTAADRNKPPGESADAH
eukprot:COSAG02_NODE_3646_length_6430_cov_5.383036_3_plen_113_part_00